MCITSPTGAMAALFENRQDDLQDCIRATPTSDSRVGAVDAFGNSLADIEVFDACRTFGRLAGELLASYALDAIELNQQQLVTTSG